MEILDIGHPLKPRERTWIKFVLLFFLSLGDTGVLLKPIPGLAAEQSVKQSSSEILTERISVSAGGYSVPLAQTATTAIANWRRRREVRKL